MRVGFDCDFPIYCFGKSFDEALRWKGLDHLTGHAENAPGWYFYRDWGWTDEQFIEFCNEGVDEGIIFTHGEPQPGARQTIDAISDMGHEIVVITDRFFGSDPSNSHRATYDWFDFHGIHFDELHFSPDKTVVHTDIYIDDRPKNVAALDDYGTESWLLDAPWNQDFYWPRRLTDITQYVGVVENMALNMV